MITFETAWEKNIYSKEKHINRYPFGEVVSTFFNSLKYLPENWSKESTEVLELGSGAGNNLWFIAENGFPATGIDGSESAVKLAQARAKERNVKANVLHGYFDKLPFENERFSIILDRASTYCGTMADRRAWWKEANRVLKPGGIVVCFSFHKDCKWGVLARTENGYAEHVEGNTWKNFKYGAFEGTGIAHLADREEMLELFSFCDIKRLLRHTCSVDIGDTDYCFDEWILVGQKKYEQ